MAINKKLIHFQTMSNFEAQLYAGNILDTSIVFIKDAKKIWTHGMFYDCSGVDDIDIPTKLSELENDAGYIKPDILGNVSLTEGISTDGNTLNVGNLRFPSSEMHVDSNGAIHTFDNQNDDALHISTTGNGTKFLADNGKYKTALTEHQDISGKQDKLVSGTNIKTINNTSLLGRGNITVATQAYVDSKIGDINTILESIIGGGSYYYGLAQYSDEELLNIVDEALEG